MGLNLALLVCAMAVVAYSGILPVSPDGCSMLACNTVNCYYGYKKDGNGCTTCECNAEEDATECQKQFAERILSKIPGKKYMRCDLDGNYFDKQEWENHYACFTKTGGLATNWIPSNEGGLDLECKCPVEKKTAEDGGAPPGKFIPQCAESGHYASKQCHGSTGHCWCVDKMSGVQKGEQVGPGQPQPECE